MKQNIVSRRAACYDYDWEEQENKERTIAHARLHASRYGHYVVVEVGQAYDGRKMRRRAREAVL